MTNILKSITEINSEINLKYSKSKLPGFLKRYILKRDRNKLKKKVDELFSKEEFPTGLLYEYYIVIKDNYHGRYRSCIKVNSNPPIMLFSIVISEDTKTVIKVQLMEPFKMSSTKISCTYSYILNGSTAFCFTEESETDYPYLIVTEEEIKVPQQKVKDLFISILKEDIKNYLYDLIEISERITGVNHE